MLIFITFVDGIKYGHYGKLHPHHEDLVQIITVFNCKLQGKYAGKARKLVKELIEEGGEDNDQNNSGNVVPQ